MQRLPAQPLLNAVRRRACAGFTLVESAYQPGARMARHGHGPARLSIVLRGGYAEQYERKTRHAAPLTVVLHPPHEAHAVAFGGRGARVLGVELETEWLARLRAAAPVLERPADFRGGPPAWLALRLYDEFRAPDALAPLAAEALLLELLVEVSRRAPTRERTVPRWLARAREILHARAAENLSLTEVAAAVGVHPVHLARAFRQFYGVTAGEYARRVRVERACRALAESDAPLSEIAVAVGFYDQSHFTNVFRRLTRMTPAKFRAHARTR